MQRRKFLKLSLVGFTSISASVITIKRKVLILLYEKLAYNKNPYRLVSSETGTLSSVEMENIVKFVSILIPYDIDIISMFTNQYVTSLCMYKPGALSVYRMTSTLLDKYTKNYGNNIHFYQLSLQNAKTIIKKIIPDIVASRRDYRHIFNLLFRFNETKAIELVANEIMIYFFDTNYSISYMKGL